MSYIANQEKFQIDSTGLITGTRVQDNTLPGSKIIDNDIPTSKIGDLQVTNGKIANLTINETKIQNSTISGGKIASATVTSTNLATTTSERDWVLARTAASSNGAVGTYALCGRSTLGSGFTVTPGSNYSGSSLFYYGLGHTTTSSTSYKTTGSALSGTWKCMGYLDADSESFTLISAFTVFMRVS